MFSIEALNLKSGRAELSILTDNKLLADTTMFFWKDIEVVYAAFCSHLAVANRACVREVYAREEIMAGELVLRPE